MQHKAQMPLEVEPPVNHLEFTTCSRSRKLQRGNFTTPLAHRATLALGSGSEHDISSWPWSVQVGSAHVGGCEWGQESRIRWGDMRKQRGETNTKVTARSTWCQPTSSAFQIRGHVRSLKRQHRASRGFRLSSVWCPPSAQGGTYRSPRRRVQPLVNTQVCLVH